MYLAFDKWGLVKVLAWIVSIWLAIVVLIMKPEDLAQGVRAISAAVFATTLTIGCLNFGWRYIWALFPKFNRWFFPDLSGVWQTEMISNIAAIAEYHPDLQGKGINSRIAGKFEIFQSSPLN